jgi:hypothetical protein
MGNHKLNSPNNSKTQQPPVQDEAEGILPNIGCTFISEGTMLELLIFNCSSSSAVRERFAQHFSAMPPWPANDGRAQDN